jgi:O-antigen/teichoic acid export membrane protein
MEYRTLTKGILRPGSQVGVTAVLIAVGLELNALLYGFIFSHFLIMVVGWILLSRLDWLELNPSETASTYDIVSYSLPLALAGVIYSTIGQIDFFMIGYFMSSENVGYYRVGFLFAGNILLVISSVKPIFKPMVSEATGDAQKIGDQFELATRWITMFVVPISITILLIPEIYLGILFSGQYAIASTAASILIIGYLINSAFGPEGMVLEGMGHTKLTLMNTAVMIVTNVILDVLLVPKYGIVGAAMGTAAGLTVGSLLGITEIYYIEGITPFNNTLPRMWVSGIIGGAIGFIVLEIIKLGLWQTALFVPAIVAVSTYLGLVASHAFNEDDKRIAMRLDNKFGISIFSRLIKI